MANDFVTSLRAEIASAKEVVALRETEVLRAQERLKRAHARRDHLEVLLADYEADAPAEVPQPPLPGIPAQESHRPVEGASAIPASTHQEGAATKKARLITEVDSVLGLRGTIHIRSLLEHLTTKRIMGHEQNPFKALGVFLATHTDRYQTDGKGNYSLRRATQAGPRFTMDDAVAAVTSRPNGHAGTTAHESSQEETGGVAPPVQP
jgi:hypothetical protein